MIWTGVQLRSRFDSEFETWEWIWIWRAKRRWVEERSGRTAWRTASRSTTPSSSTTTMDRDNLLPASIERILSLLNHSKDDQDLITRSCLLFSGNCYHLLTGLDISCSYTYHSSWKLESRATKTQWISDQKVLYVGQSLTSPKTVTREGYPVALHCVILSDKPTNWWAFTVYYCAIKVHETMDTCNHYNIHCDTVNRPQGFVTCFLASFICLIRRSARQPREDVYSQDNISQS